MGNNILISQYMHTLRNEFLVDIRRVLGAKGEYSIALKNIGNLLSNVPDGTINISINNSSNEILNASVIFDDVSRQGEVFVRLMIQDEDLVNFLNSDSLSLELEFQRVKDD